jgi:hypothetical protein
VVYVHSGIVSAFHRGDRSYWSWDRIPPGYRVVALKNQYAYTFKERQSCFLFFKKNHAPNFVRKILLYIHRYICTYIHKFIHTYIHTFIHKWKHFGVILASPGTDSLKIQRRVGSAMKVKLQIFIVVQKGKCFRGCSPVDPHRCDRQCRAVQCHALFRCFFNAGANFLLRLSLSRSLCLILC